MQQTSHIKKAIFFHTKILNYDGMMLTQKVI